MEKNTINEALMNEVSLKGSNPNQYSALTLAYIGDCIYEIYVRSYLISDGNHKVNDLHKAATSYVRASAQASFFHRIENLLTEEETAAFHRGRNTKSHPPKNADVLEYKTATGVEAMLGHLYIKKEFKRISELMDKLFE
ncbi:MAG: ribonuclease III domain-containing protein [Clostridia bacterium]|nr:ribonuclease III domain-containing protein [Clostridia bacterium]